MEGKRFRLTFDEQNHADPNECAGAKAIPDHHLDAYLADLLASGGDARLHVDPVSGLNGYGCQPFPRPQAITFASSTATSISERAYAAADRARQELMDSSAALGIGPALEARTEQMRQDLRTHLQLPPGTEVVFASSGTDAQLQAMFLARSLLGPRAVSIVIAVKETGGGTLSTACGRHFGGRTALGAVVEAGASLAGMADFDPAIGISVRDEVGAFRPLEDIDAEVVDAVASAIGDGRKVILHAMDRSKTGWRGPSQACLRSICERWPGSVQVVVDACQMRLGRPRISAYLERGYLVLVTGSKFFTGAPFSGALLVPPSLSAEVATDDDVPAGLGDYSNRMDWPLGWSAIRAKLPDGRNFGQWLRWVAALEEMRAYMAVPQTFRRAALETFASSVPAAVARCPSLELLSPCPADPSDDIDDEEMSIRTIFPFIMRCDGKALSPETCRWVYHALNADVSGCLPPGSSAAEKRLGARLCHIGQPVRLRGQQGEETAALRISAGARVVSESWSADQQVADRKLRSELRQVGIVLEKTELLLAHLDAIRDWTMAGAPQMQNSGGRATTNHDELVHDNGI